MNLYNTLTRQIEPLTSTDGVFRMYVCGITPYDTTHLGHAFTYTCFDALARYLEFTNYRTITVQNVTDIDDDILKRAAQAGIRWDELVQQETAKFQKDMRALNIRPPDHYPYASQEISQILEMVRHLLETGYAYERNGSVYYDIHHDASFGELAHMSFPEMLDTANERGNFPDDPNKRNPLDFVLWQAAKPDEPNWASPWGQGRPGWHIECSAMSLHYLGEQVDIHAGGADLIFPHHSCEIVQSERYSGVMPFARFWFHIAMVHLGGQKMSKSLGNMIFVSDLLKQFSPDAIRIYLLSHHYRTAWDADDATPALPKAEAQLGRWRTALTLTGGADTELNPLPYQEMFRAAMDDDLNTPVALEHVDELADTIIAEAPMGHSVQSAQATLTVLLGVLGVRLAQ